MSGQKLAKPQLRNLIMSQTKKSLVIGCALSLVVCLSYRVIIGDRRKKAYADFYRTYDAEKEFNRMRNAGVFQSCDPDP